jgi:hypothetical protein
LALSVPLSRFTSQVGGGSAFYVRPFEARVSIEFLRLEVFPWRSSRQLRVDRRFGWGEILRAALLRLEQPLAFRAAQSV